MRIAERALAPCELGGSNRFANPQEYLLAALNACVTVGYVGQCAVRGIALDLPSPRYRAALDRGRARSRSGPVTVGTGDRFTRLIGVAPMHYVASWRMCAAALVWRKQSG